MTKASFSREQPLENRGPQRMRAVQAPVIPIVGELVKANPGTISLGQGVVYYGPPDAVYDGIAAFQTDPANHQYKLVQGIPELLDAVSRKLTAENGIEIDPVESVVVTAGSNMGFMNVILAITDPGDEVVLPAPFYFNHEMALRMANCRPRIVPTDENHQLDIEALKAAINTKTRAIVSISPNNPSGAVYPEEALRAVNALCREHSIYHISDEAYEYFTYGDAQHFSPGSIPGAGEHTISLYSLSKAYGFASWRIGYMVIPPHLLPALKKIQDTILICPPVVAQHAAAKALEVGRRYCDQKLEQTLEIRNLMLNRLQELNGIASVARADGAFYFLLKINSERPSLELVDALIRQSKVAVIPGSAFGFEDECYLRVAYGALERATAEEGIGRLVTGLKALVGG